MQIKTTSIDGLLEIQPAVYSDDRGYFFEFFRENLLKKEGVDLSFVQENQSFSKKGVVRGLHLQLAPFEQAKLVSVVSGKVLDVVVDIRKDSKTFGQIYYCLLEGSKHNMLLVPDGFAHGFAALEDSIFFYKCSNFYNKESETGIRWNDPQLKIDWSIENPILSEKDRLLPTLEDLLKKSLLSR